MGLARFPKENRCCRLMLRSRSDKTHRVVELPDTSPEGAMHHEERNLAKFRVPLVGALLL